MQNRTLDFTPAQRESEAMPKYDVHLYAVLRFTVRGVETGSMEEACKKAEQVIDAEAIKSAMRGGSEHEAEFDEEVIEALVDVQGDEDFSKSTWLMPAGESWRRGFGLWRQREFSRREKHWRHTAGKRPRLVH